MYERVMGVRKLALTIVLIAVLLFALGLTTHTLGLELGLLGSMITFIYGFFLNSIFTFVEAKYLHYKTHMANLNANMQSLYSMALLTKHARFISALRSAMLTFIDKLIACAPEQFALAQGEVARLYETVASLKTDDSLKSRLLAVLIEISKDREQLEVYGHRYIVGELKLLFFVFTGFLSTVILFIVASNGVLFIVGGLLIFALIYLCYLIIDIDTLDYGEYQIGTGNLLALKQQITSQDSHARTRQVRGDRGRG
ncbi:hypothetical protein D6789_02570 [Candidatus Woesearchaeota archaeon]|nr:MAG: hypothetical protein D6789_02570 [Candidatus Woesearchaeota archaeon]